ncbi:MAG TPA: glycosyl hydrolase family 28 protein [Pelobium sp.]
MKKAICVILLAFSVFKGVAKTYNITNFGAKGDSLTLNTQAIQKAIDFAYNAGGGKVLIPKGTFLSGTIFLKSNVELYLAKDAVLLGSADFYQYNKSRWYSLIIANDAVNISIKGTGTINGQGRKLAKNVFDLVLQGKIEDKLELNRPHESWRPQILELSNCQNITISNITVKNGSGWVQTYIKCNNLLISNTKTESTSYWNNDGMDIVDCKNVTVKGCKVNSADDGICFKSFDPSYTSENLRVKRCTVRTSASGIKFGTASYGNFKTVKINKIFCYDNYRTVIAIESVDGGTIDDFDVKNIKGRNVGGAFFIRLGERRTKVGALKNVKFKNIDVEVAASKPDAGYENEGPTDEDIHPHNTLPSSIVGIPDAFIQNVSIKNLKINYLTQKAADFIPSPQKDGGVPLFIKAYPEFNMFGELPAWGIYLRHAKNVSFENTKLLLNGKDYRSAVVADSIDGLTLKGFKINCISKVKEPVKLINVTNLKSIQ